MKIFLIFFAAMSFAILLSNFACHLHSDQFLDHARHRDHPKAFQRLRKLPLPALVELMLTGMRKSVQTELDEFLRICGNRRSWLTRAQTLAIGFDHHLVKPADLNEILKLLSSGT